MSIHMIIYVSNIITIGSVIVVMITIGSRIRYLREQKNLSMKALAAHITETTGIKVSSGQISDWENGNRIPLQMA
ncbi:helix-turn-helix domain-containing protein [Paenibacillus melissococcoides]|uniref:helix-turn-helix domain-containing protein n=1 Tax=Paenibacillus melissococcoides TaxID=2912268 RepID=UPI0036F3F7A9